ncbi:16S rRNA (uracil(1498)-N(3))-methyltransferase [Beijerinckiaceae bacterium]|nr:16S rRNA (uracil(1498)-N(3))-methyltransferase [Beijerinckiaceae bacterium]
MSRYDFTAHRLYVNVPLAQAARFDLDHTQANYVRNVLRLTEGAAIRVFNGRDGEWETTIAASNRKAVTLVARQMTRPQERHPDLHYLFAPLKQARQDYMIQKAVEMGAGLLRPVFTRQTQVQRVNLDRMRANAIEAAEQCGILVIPEIAPAIRLDALLRDWNNERLLIFCDEDAPVQDPCVGLRPFADPERPRPVALLVGPEGGFDRQERDALLALPSIVRVSLGPRILRADTAAVAALALVQAVLGDWGG